MKTYVDIYFNSEGPQPTDIVESMRGIGLEPLRGPHDFIFEWKDDDEFLAKVGEIHKILQGLNVIYRFETVPEEDRKDEFPLFSAFLR